MVFIDRVNINGIATQDHHPLSVLCIVSVWSQGSRMGVVQYSHQGAVQAIRMDDHGVASVSSFKAKVKAMEWIAGGTWTPSALKYTYEQLILPGRRKGTKVVAIVITDGRYDPKDLDKLDALCSGVEVYAIAIGDMFDTGAERKALERIACNITDRVKTLSVYAELTAEEFLEGIERILCPGKSVQSNLTHA